LRDYADHENHLLFNELIHKTIQYLSVKEDKSNFRIQSKNLIDENELIEFNAEVYNQSYELITEPDVFLQITGNDEKKYEYTFSKKEKNYTLNAGTLPYGDYQWTAKSNINGKPTEKRGKFTIRKMEAELAQSVANHQLLRNMARNTKGKFYSINQGKELINDLLNNNNYKTISYIKIRLQELIEWKTMFYLILILIAIEWFIRKRNGLI
jgi:hypothetical protein